MHARPSIPFCRYPVRHHQGISFLLVLLAIIAGCGRGGLRRLDVHGTVSYQGTPVDDGEIVFSPRASGLPMAVGTIVGGKYGVPKQLGPALGAYEVKITAFRKTGKKVSPSPYSEQRLAADEVEQIIPAKYNEATELRVELGADQSQYDFKLDQ